MSYRYRHGDRPLEGYTILRGLGRGGFGEVYYAISDSGREVALKVIQQNADVELRGVRQCMNLKSPHLICIFDVKKDDTATPYVIMEYVAGPSFRDLIQETPEGMGVDKASYLLRETARGLNYLHDKGIVHRDLKPENIFYEDGYVKIGDYGLSKFINLSRQSGQTISVGTVHYMAPEIGSGNYSRGIDLYALGIVYYEFLTGKVPFNGDSMGEVLMKHLTAEADLAPIPEPLRPVLKKALAKKPADRYETAEAMVEAVFSVPEVRDGVARLPKGSITSRRKATAAAAIPALASPSEPAGLGALSPLGDSAQQETQAIQPPPAKSAPPPPPRYKVPDRRPRARRYGESPSLDFKSSDGSRRLIHGLLTATAMGLALTLLSGQSWLVANFVVISAGSFAILLVEGWAVKRFQIDMGIARRLTVLAVAGPALALTLNLFGSSAGQDSLAALFAGLLLVNWNLRVRPDRREQVSLEHAFYAGLVGFVAAMVTRGHAAVFTAGLLASLSLVLNSLTPSRAADLFVKPGHKKKPAAAANSPEKATPEPRSIVETPPPGGFWGRALWVVLLSIAAGFLSSWGAGLVTFCILIILVLLFRNRHKEAAAPYSGWLAMGSLLMVASWALAGTGALLASGLGMELAEEHGNDVPRWILTFGQNGEHLVFGLCLFIPAVLCLLLARRWGGAAHVLRGAMGWTGLAALIGTFWDFFDTYRLTWRDQGLKAIPEDGLIFVLIVGMASAVLLAWPGTPKVPKTHP